MTGSATFDQVGGALMVLGAGLVGLVCALRTRVRSAKPTPHPVSPARLARLHIVNEDDL